MNWLQIFSFLILALCLLKHHDCLLLSHFISYQSLVYSFCFLGFQPSFTLASLYLGSCAIKVRNSTLISLAITLADWRWIVLIQFQWILSIFLWRTRFVCNWGPVASLGRPPLLRTTNSPWCYFNMISFWAASILSGHVSLGWRVQLLKLCQPCWRLWLRREKSFSFEQSFYVFRIIYVIELICNVRSNVAIIRLSVIDLLLLPYLKLSFLLIILLSL
jgi:hypothetical protein